jgi:hypothetical protein
MDDELLALVQKKGNHTQIARNGRQDCDSKPWHFGTLIPLSGNENAYSGFDVAIESVDNLITGFWFCTI